MDKIKDDAVKDATLDVYNMVFTLRQQIPGGPLREIAKYLQPNDSDLTSALQSNYKKIVERDNGKTWKEKIAEKFTNSKSQVNIIQ